MTDVARSRAFYTSVLGFEVAADMPAADDPAYDAAAAILFGGVVLIKGTLLLGLRPGAPPGVALTRIGSVSITLASVLVVGTRSHRQLVSWTSAG